LQRRNQKLVEEAPAPFLSPQQRARIHDAARTICAEAGYTNAGTVEFLLSANGLISFLEVNTRLQVEHPVTEETTGLDIVVEQFRIAAGLPLRITETPAARGHSIEFRINAEDPGRGFLPTPGTITDFSAPSGPGVRVDSGVVTGSSVAPMFDSLLAKLIISGSTREEAIARARRALNEFRIEGVTSVLPFHRAVLQQPDFTAEGGFKVHTRWIETEFAETLTMASRPEPARDSCTVRGHVEIDGRRVELGLPEAFLKLFGSLSPHAAESGSEAEPVADAGAVCAPLPGTLRVWRVNDGDRVQEGDVVAVMEAMKMETPLTAHRTGKISLVAEAGSVQPAGAVLARIEG
jgi:acetyl-CoA/propionyl-CoA carboxylase biotin carboxyl carrier protein